MLILLTVGGALADTPVVSPFVGLQVGPAFSFSELKTTVVPRLEGGVDIGPMDGRLRAFGAVSYLRPQAQGGASDPRAADGDWSYTLKQSEWILALGGTWRFTDLDLPVVPEVSLGPEWALLTSKIDGEAGGASFGESTEFLSRLGVYAAAGAAMALGPGEANLQLAFGTSAFGGTVTGEASSAAFSPIVGYRMVF